MPWILNFAYIISISSKRIMSVQLMYECFFCVFSLFFLSSLQNLRVKYYIEGEWISEKKLAEGL